MCLISNISVGAAENGKAEKGRGAMQRIDGGSGGQTSPAAGWEYLWTSQMSRKGSRGGRGAAHPRRRFWSAPSSAVVGFYSQSWGRGQPQGMQCHPGLRTGIVAAAGTAWTPHTPKCQTNPARAAPGERDTGKGILPWQCSLFCVFLRNNLLLLFVLIPMFSLPLLH